MSKKTAQSRHVGVSLGVHERLSEISEATGLSLKSLADSLLKESLVRLEEAGGMVVDLEGNITMGAPAPKFVAAPPVNFQTGAVNQRKAEPGSEERAAEILRGPDREVKMG